MTDQSAFDAIYDALDDENIEAARAALDEVRAQATPHEIARAEAAILGAEGSIEEAADVLFEALDTHGEDSKTRVRAAEILLAGEEARGAFACVEKALEDPNLEREVADYARLMRITALRGFGQYRAALEAVLAYDTASPPLHDEALRERADLLAQLDRGAEALKVLETIPDVASDPQASWLRGQILAHQGDLDGADKAFDEARRAELGNDPPFRCSPATFDRLVKEALLHLGELGDLAKDVRIENRERGAFVTDEHGAAGSTEHGALELAYTLGSVDDEEGPIGKRPEAIVLVQRNLENAAGTEEGLRNEIATAIDAVLSGFAMECAMVDMDAGEVD